MGNNQKKPPMSWALVWVFVVVSSLIFIAGAFYIRKQTQSTLDIKKEELNAFANFKTTQIVRWWHERLGDAIILKSNYPLAEEIEYYIKNPDNQQSKEAVSQLLGSIVRTFDYQNALVLDTSGNVKLSIPDDDSTFNFDCSSLIPSISDDEKVMLTDLHRISSEKPVQLDLVVPIEIVGKTGTRPVGTIILRIDPEMILFSIIKLVPTLSNTFETLLLRKEGDSIVYLNELRYLPGQPLSVKRAIADTNLLASKAVRGQTGVVRGIDYRGVEVMGALKKVAGSGWYMVSKIDMKEVNSIIISEVAPVILLILLIIAAFGAVIGWTIWNHQVRYYKVRYDAERERLALRKNFEYILQYANDIILLMDADLNIVDANDHAFEIYNYSREEMIGSGIRLLVMPGSDDHMNQVLQILEAKGTAIYETIHRRKDGTTFSLEISARVFEIEGKKYYHSIGRDITERKIIEEKLNTILERFDLAIKAAGLAVWDYDLINNMLIWDERVFELYGVEKGDHIPVYESWLNRVHPDDRELADSTIKAALKGDSYYNTEFRILIPDGSEKYIKSYGHVLRDSTGAPVRITGINYDITEQKNSEKLLRDREFWLKESQRVGRIGSYIMDIPELIWSSSDVLDDLFGIGKDYQRTLDGWNKIVHPGDLQMMLDYVENHVIKGKQLFEKEYRIINIKTGLEHWVYGRGELRFNKEGDPVLMIGTIQDITERKRAELLLQETEQAYSGLFHTVSDSIYVHKADGIFIDVNSGAVEMYGYPMEELIGMTPADVGAPGKNDMDEIGKILTSVFKTGKSRQFEFWGRRKNGEIFPKEVVSNKGRYFGQDVIISTARDITLRKNHEDQLRQAKEKAEESDRLKTAFLHNISHEIRTPMNAIVGFTALLDEPDMDADSRKHFISIINQSTSQLLGIISDIVDISNIETGQVKLTISDVNINEIVIYLFEQYKLIADQQKILFHYEVKLSDERAIIHTDKTKLIQVISNLLNNAFKFTKQGTIQFGYRTNKREIEFFVKDTGIGVPSQKQKMIFDRFYQIENDSTRQYGGAGLGLSISKAYVELLGGKIWLDSKPGSGTEFIFTHPV